MRAERAWVALLDGRHTQAERWAEEVDASRLEQFAGEPEALMLARVRRAQRRVADMVPLLERMLAAAQRTGRGHSTIGILVQLALAREQNVDGVGSLAALEQAVTQAEPNGYVRTFVDEGEAILSLLRPLLEGGVGIAYLAGLLDAFGLGRDDAAVGVELLTPRERDVLRLLAVGMSNRAIAARLVTSEATIKSHVHRLIGKFGVSTRAQAVIRARQRGLIG